VCVELKQKRVRGKLSNVSKSLFRVYVQNVLLSTPFRYDEHSESFDVETSRVKCSDMIAQDVLY
jgi:hypothetical protein